MKKIITHLILLLAVTCVCHAQSHPLYPAPDMAQVRQLRQCDFGSGETETKTINDLVFAVYYHNNDKDFCARMEKALLDELADGKGTPRYRMMLAQLVQAVGVQKAGAKRLEKIIAAEKDESVRSRLAEALAHTKRGTSIIAEKQLSIPSALPASAQDQALLIDYLGSHPETPLPAYLVFENLSEPMKPRLVYALLARGKNEMNLWALDPATPELALALGCAFSKETKDAQTLTRLLSFAPMLDKEQAAQMAIYLAQAPLPSRADVLAGALGSQDSSVSKLAASALALMDLSHFGRKFLAGYDSANADEKRAMLKVCESLADEYVFCEIARRLPVETSASLRTAMQRALMRISQAVFTPAMFAAVENAYAQTAAPAKAFWLRFAPLHDSENAIALCTRAHAEKLRSDAIKTLGAWKSPLAVDALVSISKAADDDHERLLAQTMLVTLMERVGTKSAALDYLRKNAASDDVKAATERIANAKPKKK